MLFQDCALFLYRDGFIYNQDYFNRLEDFNLIESIIDAVRVVASQHFQLVLISKQAGNERGYYSGEHFLGIDTMDVRSIFIARRSNYLSILFSISPHGRDWQIQKDDLSRNTKNWNDLAKTT